MALAACGGQSATVGVDANMGAGIGISMPTKVSTRWISDGNSIRSQFTDMGYKVDLQFANNDVKLQNAQVQSMIDKGDKLLLITAVDGSSMSATLDKAAAKGVQVIAYDRLLTNTKDVNFMATFDNTRVGTMQGSLLATRLGLTKGKKGPFNV